MLRRILSLRAYFWPVAIAVLILSASHRSRVASPEIVNIDKLAHFAVYGLLATLLCRLRHGWRAAWGALIIVSAFGATDEWHQSFVPGRESELADWVADTCGAALAVALYQGSTHYRRLLERPLFGRHGATPPGTGVGTTHADDALG